MIWQWWLLACKKGNGLLKGSLVNPTEQAPAPIEPEPEVEPNGLTRGRGTPAETPQLSSTPSLCGPVPLLSHSVHGSNCRVLWSHPDGQTYRKSQSLLNFHIRCKEVCEVVKMIISLVTHRVSTYAFSSTFHTLTERSWEALYRSWVPLLNERPWEGQKTSSFYMYKNKKNFRNVNIPRLGLCVQ